MNLIEATIKALTGEKLTEAVNKDNTEINTKILDPISNKQDLEKNGYDVDIQNRHATVKRNDRKDDTREITVFDDNQVVTVGDKGITYLSPENKEAFDAKNFLDTDRKEEEPTISNVEKFKRNKDTIAQADEEIASAETAIDNGEYDKADAERLIIRPWKKMKSDAEIENSEMLDRRTLGERKVVESDEEEVPYDNTTEKTCPRCGKKYTQFPALSRRDNKTYICPDCGVAEAMEDYLNSRKKTESATKSKYADVENAIKEAYANIADVKVTDNSITITAIKATKDNDGYICATSDFLNNVEEIFKEKLNKNIETSDEGESAEDGKSFTISYEEKAIETESVKVEEDDTELDEAFYEKICRAYINSMNLEWVVVNPENDSVAHGYFNDDTEAEKYNYGADVTSENFKEVVNGEDFYDYDTWEDFYEDYVKENIQYDIPDIGLYGPDGYDFYISKEDLEKLGFDLSEYLEESSSVGKQVSDKILSIENEDGDTIMQFKVSAQGTIYDFENCEIADEEDDLIRIQQIGIFGGLNESKSESNNISEKIAKYLYNKDHQGENAWNKISDEDKEEFYNSNYDRICKVADEMASAGINITD